MTRNDDGRSKALMMRIFKRGGRADGGEDGAGQEEEEEEAGLFEDGFRKDGQKRTNVPISHIR